MKSLTGKLLVTLMTILMVTTIGTQVYYMLHDKHDIAEAVIAEIDENISFKGVVVRDEQVITYSGGGVLDYQYEDGSKVSVNSAVANVYDSQESIVAKSKIEEIDKQINNLKRAQNPGTTNFVKPEILKKSVDENYKNVLECYKKEDYDGLRQAKNDLQFSMNIYNIITGTEKSYSSKITELNKLRSSYMTDVKNPKSVIKAPKTGYFVANSDGYEGKLTTGKAASISQDSYHKILKGKVSPEENSIGKIFDSYKCKIVAEIDNDKRVAEGGTLQMQLNSSGKVYDVAVDAVNPCDDGKKSMVVLSCDRLDKYLVESRVVNAQLIFDEYKGIKVPRKAMRFRGSQKGVYVILGKDISFKKIDVIYEGDDYVLSKNTSDPSYLLMYDQILLEVVSDKDVSDSRESESSGK